MAVIYHIAFVADWKQAQRDGEYRVSTRGRSLEEQGFIHAGMSNQVAPVANAIYRQDDELVVLVVDVGRLTAEVRFENVRGWESPFPHIYGPLNVDAVTETLPLETDADGRFSFAADQAPPGG